MDVFYKKIKANVTPEVLAQLHSKKIILGKYKSTTN
ncbi:Anthranilate synthase component I [Staphylococcus aureus]|uniref:Anthranilate synthase component I n=1 Tax=Staphylococcus aureus TaxID=1280 RepID=A0A380DZ38_STAAU|nr:Anthranilate synthase component I [Staphylococcus aureus]